MLGKFFNRLGYYKLDQLCVGGHCGICGQYLQKAICLKENGGWTLCKKCEKQ